MHTYIKRERERETEREREREKQRETERERERLKKGKKKDIPEESLKKIQKSMIAGRVDQHGIDNQGSNPALN